MKDFLKGKKLILASGSPRRQTFFKDLHLSFEIRLKPIDEVFPSRLKGKAITNYLAKLKAAAFAGEIKVDEILVTSDTIVWFNGKALNKPQDEQEAIKMLSKLSGKTHQVITSVCIKTIDKEVIFHDKTDVKFVKLMPNEIAYYVNQFMPLDKAGAYGIQEWIGLIGIKSINGSYCNVVGLPTHKLFQYLKKIV